MNNHFFIDKFEERLSEYTGAPYVVLTDSCTNAIFLCLYYLKKFKKLSISKSLIQIPKHTYISVPLQLMHLELMFVFTDDKWSGIYEIGELNVYDAAQRLTSGMYLKDSFMCLSFQQKKILSIGKGGAILLNDKEDYEILRRLSWDGRDSSIPVSQDSKIIHGFHMNMTPDMAAVGILKLNALPLKIGDSGSWNDYPDISDYSVFKNR